MLWYMSRMLLVMVLVGFVTVRVAYRRRGDGERRAVRPARERWLTRFMTVTVALPTAAWLGTPMLGFAQLALPELVGWLGYGAGLLGVGLLAWAHDTLGRHFSPWLELRGDHRLVTTGPYRWVRHPIYSAGVLLILGCGAISGNLLVLGGPAAGLAVLLALRLPDEEAMLEDQFGAQYHAWSTTTGRLLPRWGRARTAGPTEDS
jgi:protein-S-isoprenylcysteine O-methyltransferase Ste14